jgi:rare lipoprotein A (peptidoglycan hydrolase)
MPNRKWEPLHKPATKPYVVLGKEYVPNTAVKPYKARGIASWYGKKFHGQKTSIGEPYDMFAMTAAHPRWLCPPTSGSPAQQSGKSVIVRVTDRGPFHADRVIDLSYTAAYKLGLINGGSGQVEVEAIIPGEPAGTTYAQVTPPPRPDCQHAEVRRHGATGPPHGRRGEARYSLPRVMRGDQPEWRPQVIPKGSTCNSAPFRAPKMPRT